MSTKNILKNMHRIKWLKVLIIALLLLVTLSSCAVFPWLPAKGKSSPGPLPNGSKDARLPPGSINLGMVVALAGPLAPAAKEAISGAEVAMEQIEESGGIKGRPARLIVRDSGATSGQALAEAKSLLADYKVSAIIAPLTSREAYAIARSIDGAALLLTYMANAQYMTI
ncbi:MAG: Periplasmic binding protein, partial [Dehalococcoidia bacterium]|nr:Periplasmic binding protein [Dehalococcoidia bacterium]